MGDTKIEWTDKTWNPVRGCALVSEGCRSCYAMKVAHRFSGEGMPYAGLTELGPAGPRWTGQVRTVPDALLEPLSWRKPRRVFVNSMSDLFHAGVSLDFLARVFAVMRGAPQHTFQVLTKRPDRMLSVLGHRFVDLVDDAAEEICAEQGWCHLHDDRQWPLPNVWLGVSCENQKAADERIPLLLQTPAAVRFVSAEPLLGPIEIRKRQSCGDCDPCLGGRPDQCAAGPYWLNPLGDGIDWVIVGGESGPGARPCAVEWIERIVDQCRAAGIAPFVKQLGADPRWAEAASAPIAPARGKGGDMADWPLSLRVREFPTIPVSA